MQQEKHNIVKAPYSLFSFLCVSICKSKIEIVLWNICKNRKKLFKKAAAKDKPVPACPESFSYILASKPRSSGIHYIRTHAFSSSCVAHAIRNY